MTFADHYYRKPRKEVKTGKPIKSGKGDWKIATIKRRGRDGTGSDGAAGCA